MEHRMELTDIKTARSHRESFPFLRANIQRLVGGPRERDRERECKRLSSFKCEKKILKRGTNPKIILTC